MNDSETKRSDCSGWRRTKGKRGNTHTHTARMERSGEKEKGGERGKDGEKEGVDSSRSGSRWSLSRLLLSLHRMATNEPRCHDRSHSSCSALGLSSTWLPSRPIHAPRRLLLFPLRPFTRRLHRISRDSTRWYSFRARRRTALFDAWIDVALPVHWNYRIDRNGNFSSVPRSGRNGIWEHDRSRLIFFTQSDWKSTYSFVHVEEWN